MNIKSANLTQALIHSSKRLFEKEEGLTWFKDDTHWNKQGIAVAVKVLCDNLESLNCISLN